MTYLLFRRTVAAVFSILLVIVLLVSLLTNKAAAEDPLVQYGLTASTDGQYVPVFDRAGSGTKIALLNPGELCALDSYTLISRHFWYRVVFYNEDGVAQAGYLKESNFEQLSASALEEQMRDPEKAVLLAKYTALAESSTLFQGKETSLASTPSGEKRRNYVLNTNTKKFHYPDCRSVKQMKDKNRKDYYGTRTEVINQGYVPCKNCDP